MIQLDFFADVLVVGKSDDFDFLLADLQYFHFVVEFFLENGFAENGVFVLALDMNESHEFAPLDFDEVLYGLDDAEGFPGFGAGGYDVCGEVAFPHVDFSLCSADNEDSFSGGKVDAGEAVFDVVDVADVVVVDAQHVGLVRVDVEEPDHVVAAHDRDEAFGGPAAFDFFRFSGDGEFDFFGV